MTARANRRGSVEINQLTQWKHQQNLEEIKMLKLNANSAPTTSFPAQQNSSLNSTMQGKLSKLSSRLQKASSASTLGRFDQVSESQLPSAPQMVSKMEQFRPPQEPHVEHSERSAFTPRGANSNVKQSELDALLKEKQQWLRSIHEDNTKMAMLLKVLLFYFPFII